MTQTVDIENTDNVLSRRDSNAETQQMLRQRFETQPDLMPAQLDS